MSSISRVISFCLFKVHDRLEPIEILKFEHSMCVNKIISSITRLVLSK